MNRKGKGVGALGAILGIAAVLLVVIAGAAYLNMKGDSAQQAASIAAASVPAQQSSTGAITTPVALVSCPSDGTTDGQVRYRDSLASTITYDDPVVYFVSKTAGISRVTAGTLQTDGTYSTAVNLKCTEAGTHWQAVAVTKQNEAASAEGPEFIAEGSYVKQELVGKDIDSLKFKVEDKFTGGAKFFNTTGIADGNAGTYDAFNASDVPVINHAATTGTSLTLGTDGYIDSRIYLKTNTTKKQYGEDGLRTFLLVDADGSEWSEPIVSRDGGAKLSNVIDSLSSDDRRKYSGYEYAYEVGSFNDKESYIDFYLQSASGVNPSGDPTLTLCAEGRYNSVKEADTIKIGCWTDAATQAEVATSNTPKFHFVVA